MHSPKISVIVPVYNTERYLHRCIDSILAQTFTDFELLLINDGSTDSSGAICDEYAQEDSRIRVFHKENGGVSSARNVGLEHARNAYITFVDSDDQVKESYLDILLEEMKDDVDFVCGGYEFVVLVEDCKLKNVSEKDVPRKCLTKNEGLIRMLNGGRWNWNLCSKLFKSSVVRENAIMFDEKYSLCEDKLFIAQYISCLQGHISIIPNNVYKYYLYSDNTTSRYEYRIDDAVLKGFECSAKIYQLFHDGKYPRMVKYLVSGDFICAYRYMKKRISRCERVDRNDWMQKLNTIFFNHINRLEYFSIFAVRGLLSRSSICNKLFEKIWLMR